MFIYCEFGERVTSEFNELDDMIGQLNWYLCPLEIQRILPFVIKNTQKPIVIQAFRQFFCTREEFKAVSSVIKRIEKYQFKLISINSFLDCYRWFSVFYSAQ